jgi:hypothetical protein
MKNEQSRSDIRQNKNQPMQHYNTKHIQHLSRSRITLRECKFIEWTGESGGEAAAARAQPAKKEHTQSTLNIGWRTHTHRYLLHIFFIRTQAPYGFDVQQLRWLIFFFFFARSTNDKIWYIAKRAWPHNKRLDYERVGVSDNIIMRPPPTCPPIECIAFYYSNCWLCCDINTSARQK